MVANGAFYEKVRQEQKNFIFWIVILLMIIIILHMIFGTYHDMTIEKQIDILEEKVCNGIDEVKIQLDGIELDIKEIKEIVNTK